MGEKRSAQMVLLVRKLGEKRPLERLRCRNNNYTY
jgi:hypothetical protein